MAQRRDPLNAYGRFFGERKKMGGYGDNAINTDFMARFETEHGDFVQNLDREEAARKVRYRGKDYTEEELIAEFDRFDNNTKETIRKKVREDADKGDAESQQVYTALQKHGRYETPGMVQEFAKGVAPFLTAAARSIPRATAAIVNTVPGGETKRIDPANMTGASGKVARFLYGNEAIGTVSDYARSKPGEKKNWYDAPLGAALVALDTGLPIKPIAGGVKKLAGMRKGAGAVDEAVDAATVARTQADELAELADARSRVVDYDVPSYQRKRAQAVIDELEARAAVREGVEGASRRERVLETGLRGKNLDDPDMPAYLRRDTPLAQSQRADMELPNNMAGRYLLAEMNQIGTRPANYLDEVTFNKQRVALEKQFDKVTRDTKMGEIKKAALLDSLEQDMNRLLDDFDASRVFDKGNTARLSDQAKGVGGAARVMGGDAPTAPLGKAPVADPPTVAALKAGNPEQVADEVLATPVRQHPDLMREYGSNPVATEAVEASAREVTASLEKEVGPQLKGKVNLLDWVRTPDRVLRRIGLGDVATKLRGGLDNYHRELRNSSEMLQKWQARVGNSPEASQRIFRVLDGDKSIVLNGEETRVAGEIREYLKGWADKLGLKQDERVTDYITHIFEDSFKRGEVDLELSRILSKKPNTNVSSPFTKQRTGGKGYIEDAFKALEAYTKKGARQASFMEPLGDLQKAVSANKNIDDATIDYLTKVVDTVKGRPATIDKYSDNLINAITGGRAGERATARSTRATRNTIYRATLGLNVGSALRNLTQGVNTFARLGARDTLKGYVDFTKVMADAARSKSLAPLQELIDAGIMDDNFFRESADPKLLKEYTRFKEALKVADEGLWGFFNIAEAINKGSAYYASKARALRKNMSEADAIQAALKDVRDTQFKFSAIDTPIALRSDIAKTLTQFQSFNLKQLEFLGSMVKDKNLAGLIRWAGANAMIAGTVGELFGFDIFSALPSFRLNEDKRKGPIETALLGSPVGQIAQATVDTARGAPDAYGNERTRMEAGGDLLSVLNKLAVPGGTQIQKSVGGVQSVRQGYSDTEKGNVRFIVDNNTANMLRGLFFGEFNLPGAEEFFEGERKGQVFQGKTAEVLKAAPPEERARLYGMFSEGTNAYQEQKQTREKIQHAQEAGDIAEARRLAAEHNARVDEMFSEWAEFPKYRDQYKISVNRPSRRRKATPLEEVLNSVR